MFGNKEEFSRDDPKNYRKFYWLKILNYFVPVLIVIVGIFVTTQEFAPFMNYDESVIGRPLYTFKDGYRLYNPLVFLLGIFKFMGNQVYSHYFFQAAPPALFSIILAFFLFVVTSIILSAHQKNQRIYGTARWARIKDLKELGHLQRYGVVCGELEKASVYSKINPQKGNLVLHLRKSLVTQKAHVAPLICHSGATNTWMIAPTRSGKGVSTIIPTCLNYGIPYYKSKASGEISGRGSIVVFDPKGENFEASAGYREQFSVVIPFRPLDSNGETAHYNPINEIPDDPTTAFSWADMIGENFFSAEKAGGDETSSYFNNRARDIFTAVVLHVRFSKQIPWKEKNMSTVLKKFSQKDDDADEEIDEDAAEGSDELLDELIHDDHGDPLINELISNSAKRAQKQPPKERGSTYSTIFSKISLFQDPLIAASTAYSDFSVDDFINSKNGISLYLIVPYNHITRIAPVFRMLINFMIKKFSDGTTNANSVKLKNPCLFLLDEFPVLGYFPEIAKNMGILAGYGVTFFIVSQSINQIVDVYGENHPFLDHCKTKIIYAPGNIKDARMISESIGNRSVLIDNISSNMASASGANLSSQEVSVSLVNPDELTKLEFSRCIVLLEGKPPYKGKKVVYYEDPRFKDKQFLPVKGFNDLMKAVQRLPSARAAIAKQKSDAEKTSGENEMAVLDELPLNYDPFLE
ncbi:MAG: type IV secretory system conjugative DNA transfer family protein [Treponemataceae bacterium]|nr:type IV secretory system conjugative DNA transfer family protein [Treponemataceae bacterium]